jgi:sirohydrochlorin ferrochelatase
MRPDGLKRPVLLVAHGSRDPRAAATTRALARTVAAVRPGLDVRVAFLELAEPRPADVLRGMPAGTVVVPLLLTRAYHGAVDLPAQVAGFDCTITETLGSVSEPLLDALTRRLSPGRFDSGRFDSGRFDSGRFDSGRFDSGRFDSGRFDFDALVLAAAGTRVEAARATVREVAVALGGRLGLPCRVAYAAGATPSGAEAVAALQNQGARRVGVASYFLAPGRLYDAVTSSALEAGAVAAAPPLGASWQIAELILSQVDSATTHRHIAGSLSGNATTPEVAQNNRSPLGLRG